MPLRLLTVCLAAAGIVLVFWFAVRLIGLLRVATGLTSHTLCSAVFVSGLDPASVHEQTLAPIAGMGLVRWALSYEVERERREVRAGFLGQFASRAVFRPGLGCRVLRGNDSVPDEAPPLPSTPAFKPEATQIAHPRLAAALDRVFASAGPVYGWTTAVVVVKDGRIAAERYAPGVTPNTPLLGWSATKSVTSALIGILVRQNRLAIGQRAAVTEWRDPADPRHAITVEHLLQMRSGLNIPETHTGFDPVSRMLYIERDMGAFAARARLRAQPGVEWRYTSGNTLILCRLIRDLVGGRASDVLRFAHAELFEPLGMHTPVLEFDATGTPIGSTYLFASARDWARFGELYLQDGVISGRRILPEGWVRYSSTPTPGTNYAAGFWTAQPQWGLPPDAFLARGFLGQAVVIVPSERLVLARFGAFHRADRELETLGPLLREAIAALRASTSSGGRDLVRI